MSGSEREKPTRVQGVLKSAMDMGGTGKRRTAIPLAGRAHANRRKVMLTGRPPSPGGDYAVGGAPDGMNPQAIKLTELPLTWYASRV